MILDFLKAVSELISNFKNGELTSFEYSTQLASAVQELSQGFDALEFKSNSECLEMVLFDIFRQRDDSWFENI